jgi:5-oxoprolinase (ATP-hydrolysing)
MLRIIITFDLISHYSSVSKQVGLPPQDLLAVSPLLSTSPHPILATHTGKTGETVCVLQVPDPAIVRAQLEVVYATGIRSLAVVFMHSYTYSAHEEMVGAIARELGFEQISLSSELMPMVKAVPRGYTACVDAYLTPCIRRYLKTFQSGFDSKLFENAKVCVCVCMSVCLYVYVLCLCFCKVSICLVYCYLLLYLFCFHFKNIYTYLFSVCHATFQVNFMQSDGGLASVHRFYGFRAILSGPAGGVVGYAKTTFDPQSQVRLLILFEICI